MQQNGNIPRNDPTRQHSNANGSERPVWKSIPCHDAEEFEALERSRQLLRAWDRGPFDDGEVDDGLSTSVDALDAYGNSVVPQIPELIGHAILSAINK
jgi:hypothetical protein